MRVRVTRYTGEVLGWWGLRSAREQVLLALLLATAAAALYLSLVFAPIQAVRRQALNDIRVYEALGAQLRVAGPALLSARPTGGDASAVAAASAAEAGVAVRRIDPEGERVRVVLQDVSFDALMRWIDLMERERGLRLVELRVERRTSPGLVSADVTVRRP